MKWLFFLLALYTLILPCIPCSGNDDCCAKENAMLTVPAPQQEHPGSQPVCPCCPSFACVTCHAMVLHEDRLDVSPYIKSSVLFHPSYSSRLISSSAFTIWQPPKSA